MVWNRDKNAPRPTEETNPFPIDASGIPGPHVHEVGEPCTSECTR